MPRETGWGSIFQLLHMLYTYFLTQHAHWLRANRDWPITELISTAVMVLTMVAPSLSPTLAIDPGAGACYSRVIGLMCRILPDPT